VGGHRHFHLKKEEYGAACDGIRVPTPLASSHCAAQRGSPQRRHSEEQIWKQITRERVFPTRCGSECSGGWAGSGGDAGGHSDGRSVRAGADPLSLLQTPVPFKPSAAFCARCSPLRVVLHSSYMPQTAAPLQGTPPEAIYTGRRALRS